MPPPMLFPPSCRYCRFRRLSRVVLPVVKDGRIVEVVTSGDLRGCDKCGRVYQGRPWFGPIPGPIVLRDDTPRQLPPSFEGVRRRHPVAGWREFAIEHRAEIVEVDGKLAAAIAAWQARAV